MEGKGVYHCRAAIELANFKHASAKVSVFGECALDGLKKSVYGLVMFNTKHENTTIFTHSSSKIVLNL